jgi:glutamyl-tRNA reductase
MYGVSHRTAPVELRERLSIPPAGLQEALRSLRRRIPATECVILSTCNRVEVYLACARLPDPRLIARFLCGGRPGISAKIEKALSYHSGAAAARHLFRVAAGLESMVLGENQIAGQVRDAWRSALRARCAGPVLGPVFEGAIRASRAARRKTLIGEGSVSISSVAIALAEEILGSLDGRAVMIVGAGKIGELAVKHLVRRGAKTVMVSNRTYTRARELAERLGGEAVRFDRVFERMRGADIVISSTGAPHRVIRAAQVKMVMKARGGAPLFFIDLAVPRDIDPAVCRIRNVHCHDIDDLERVRDASLARRVAEVKKVEEIIEGHLARLEGE